MYASPVGVAPARSSIRAARGWARRALDQLADDLHAVARRRIGPAERRIGKALVEVAEDEERLGQRPALGLEHRHLAGRVDRQEGRVQLLERGHVDCPQLVLEALLGQPHLHRLRQRAARRVVQHEPVHSASPSASRACRARAVMKPRPIAKPSCRPGRAWQRRSQLHKCGVVSGETSSGRETGRW